MKPRTILRWAGGLLLGLGLVGGGVIWIAAEQLVRPPLRSLQPYHADWLEAPAGHGMALSFFTACGDRVPTILCRPVGGPAERGRILREQLAERGCDLPNYGEVRATLVLLHGRKGRKEDLLPVAERFVAAGFRCLLPDLPAHGESPVKRVAFGASDWETGLPSAVLEEAAKRFDFDPAEAGLWGMSMGGAFAVQARGEWKARVIVASFARLERVVEEGCRKWVGPLAGPVSDLILSLAEWRGGFPYCEVRPVEAARAISAPVLMAHGDADDLLSLAEGRRLFEALGSEEKRWLVVPDGGHDDVLITPMPLYAEMAAWYLDHL